MCDSGCDIRLYQKHFAVITSALARHHITSWAPQVNNRSRKRTRSSISLLILFRACSLLVRVDLYDATFIFDFTTNRNQLEGGTNRLILVKYTSLWSFRNDLCMNGNSVAIYTGYQDNLFPKKSPQKICNC